MSYCYTCIINKRRRKKNVRFVQNAKQRLVRKVYRICVNPDTKKQNWLWNPETKNEKLIKMIGNRTNKKELEHNTKKKNDHDK